LWQNQVCMALERLDHCQNSAHDTNQASKFLCLSLIASANYVHSLKHGLMYIRHFFLSFLRSQLHGTLSLWTLRKSMDASKEYWE
jgi:hypothetical protein